MTTRLSYTTNLLISGVDKFSRQLTINWDCSLHDIICTLGMYLYIFSCVNTLLLLKRQLILKHSL